MQTTILNPAVSAAAEWFTDGRITDQVLLDVAAQNGLPLYIDPTIPTLAPALALVALPGSSALEQAEAELARWQAAVTAARAIYVAARSAIGHANRGIVVRDGFRIPFARPVARRVAFRDLNRARASLARNERRLAAAEAALAALTVAPIALAA